MAFGSTSNTYLPSRSVIVPFVVPFTTTLTPNRGSPLVSVIVPVIFRDCCVTEVSAFNTELCGMIAPPANKKHKANPSLLLKIACLCFIINRLIKSSKLRQY